jgi:hypothetical protein
MARDGYGVLATAEGRIRALRDGAPSSEGEDALGSALR